MFIAQRDFERAMELVDRSECFYSHLVNKFVVIVEQIEYVQLGVKGVYLLMSRVLCLFTGNVVACVTVVYQLPLTLFQSPATLTKCYFPI